MYSARVQTFAGRLGLSLVLALALASLLVLLAGLWQARKKRQTTSPSPAERPA